MQPPWHLEDGSPAADAGLSPISAGQGVSVIGAVKQVFADPDWKHNVLFALIFMMIPVVGPIALSGWMCEVQQRKARQHPKPVAYIEFADFGEYIKRGLAVFLVSLATTFPLILVLYAAMGAVAAVVMLSLSATNEPILAAVLGGVAGIVAVVVLLCAGVVITAAHTRAELTESFGETFRMRELLAYIKATFWKVLVKNFLFSFVAFGLVLVGMLACYVGLYPAIAVIQIASMHLRFQVYDDYLAKGGEPIALKDPVPLPSEQRAAQYATYAGH